MAETEFEIVRRDGNVHMLMFDDTDDLEVVTMTPTDAWVLGNALVEKAQQEEDDTE